MPATNSTPAALPRFRCRWAGVAGLLWALGAALVYNDTAVDSTAGPAQLIGAAVVAVALIAAAFTVRPARTQSSAKAPSWWLVSGVTGVAWCASQLLPATWAGVTVNVVALVVLGWLLLRWSSRQGWSPRHVLAARAVSSSFAPGCPSWSNHSATTWTSR